MAELTISERVWQDLVTVARRRRQHAGRLAEKVLRDYLQRLADEELLARSEFAARRSRFRMADTEEIVRHHRRRSKLT